MVAISVILLLTASALSLRLDELTFSGTRRSYHAASSTVVPYSWRLTRRPLRDSLKSTLNSVELDFHWTPNSAELLVMHMPVFDEGTTCATVARCTAEIAAWSDSLAGKHGPVLLTLTLASGENTAALWRLVWHDIASVWGNRKYVDARDVACGRTVPWAVSPEGRLAKQNAIEEQKKYGNARDQTLLKCGWPERSEADGRLVLVFRTRGGQIAAVPEETPAFGAQLLTSVTTAPRTGVFWATEEGLLSVENLRLIQQIRASGMLVRAAPEAGCCMPDYTVLDREMDAIAGVMADTNYDGLIAVHEARSLVSATGTALAEYTVHSMLLRCNEQLHLRRDTVEFVYPAVACLMRSLRIIELPVYRARSVSALREALDAGVNILANETQNP